MPSCAVHGVLYVSKLEMSAYKYYRTKKKKRNGIQSLQIYRKEKKILQIERQDSSSSSLCMTSSSFLFKWRCCSSCCCCCCCCFGCAWLPSSSRNNWRRYVGCDGDGNEDDCTDAVVDSATFEAVPMTTTEEDTTTNTRMTAAARRTTTDTRAGEGVFQRGK